MFAADARKHTPGKNAEKENFSMRIHLSRAESKAMAKRARLRLLLLGAVSLALLGVHGHLFASSIALAELSVAVSLMMATAGFGIQ